MPKFEDFKVGDVWVLRDGEAGTVERIDTVDKTILIFFGEFRLWYHGSGRFLCQEDKYNLIHKKLDTSKPVRVIDDGKECYTVVGEMANGDLILEDKQGYLRHVSENLLENVGKRKVTMELELLDVGGTLCIGNSSAFVHPKVLGRKTVEIEEGEGL